MDDDIGTQEGRKRIHSVESIFEPERGTSEGDEIKTCIDLGPKSQRPKSWRPLKPHQETDSDLDVINQTASMFQRCSLNKPVTIATQEQQLYNDISKPLRIVVVGDIHEEWNLIEDELALHFLQPDLVLFTGDIGNENVELVRSVASLQVPKAVILGNHDSWGTQKFSTKYGIKDMDGSAKLISKAALGTPEEHLVILLAHNGPKGLGSNINGICGKDWVEGGGDHGDPDLAQAISHIKETTNFFIPLVVFGHMHKQLENGNRKMTLVGDANTVYVNGAIVPRVKELVGNKGTIRAFTVVDFFDGRLFKIVETWVSVIGDQMTLVDEQVLFTIDEKVE